MRGVRSSQGGWTVRVRVRVGFREVRFDGINLVKTKSWPISFVPIETLSCINRIRTRFHLKSLKISPLLENQERIYDPTPIITTFPIQNPRPGRTWCSIVYILAFLRPSLQATSGGGTKVKDFSTTGHMVGLPMSTATDKACISLLQSSVWTMYLASAVSAELGGNKKNA